ncbi:MAG: endonuclease/exonuclease/phosphatase family protein [Candidatus Marinimicrobia bacterium]|nr:endonuclease/exonuclease/phosphatase family protein [Candidatus Neomarinimicrobiota bacterium]
MRFLLYNIRYGTGSARPLYPWSGYLGRTGRNLAALTTFIASLDPDVVGLIEVDLGSYRSHRCNQAELLAKSLGHFHTHRIKYPARQLTHYIPVINKQGNAFLTRDTITREHFHYTRRGMKRLVIELELDDVVIFLVHLALTFQARHHQLHDLFELVRATRKPCLVAGDFNPKWGGHELALFSAAAGLRNANPDGLPTYPSWAPRRQLDFILHSPNVEIIRFERPLVQFSDHLPLYCDFATR